MKILVIGEVYSPNLGDPIINESVSYLITEKYKNVNIKYLDLSTREGYLAGENIEISKNKKNIINIINKMSTLLTKMGLDTDYYKMKWISSSNKKYFEKFFLNNNFDLAIFAGGQIFKDTFIFSLQFILDELNKKNIPVIFNGIGYGQIQSPGLKKLLKNNLTKENVKIITTRDDKYSIEKILSNTDVKVNVIDDPAIWAADVYKIEKQKSNVIGLGVMNVPSMEYNSLLSFWIEIIEELERKNYKWKLFCNGSLSDYELLLDILTKLNISKKDKNKYSYSRPKRPRELVKNIASFDTIISFRLHSHIIAYSLNIPSIGIVWNPKVKYFFNGMGMQDKYFNINTNVNRIISLLDNTENNHMNTLLQKKLHCQNSLYKNIDMII